MSSIIAAELEILEKNPLDLGDLLGMADTYHLVHDGIMDSSDVEAPMLDTAELYALSKLTKGLLYFNGRLWHG